MSADTVSGGLCCCRLRPRLGPCLLQRCLHAGRWHTWSGTSPFGWTLWHVGLLIPQTRTQLGRRSFHGAAPTVWNSLPTHLHSTSISRGQFRDGLKTHLFAQAYASTFENVLVRECIDFTWFDLDYSTGTLEFIVWLW